MTLKWIVTASLEALAAHLYLEQIRDRVATEDEAACQMTIMLQGRASKGTSVRVYKLYDLLTS